MEAKNPTIPCPTCGKPQSWNPENRFRPFCGERCKLIDLGAWADESHRIAGDPINPEPGEDDKE
jgi:endogenous inhibitor of DNA gyrase (YacG/DUF329 family)